MQNYKCPWKKLLLNIRASGRRAKVYTKKRKGIEIEFNISKEDLKNIYDKQNKKCYWFDVFLEPNLIFEKGNPLSISADRIDNNRGYTKDNIVICCRLANLGRQNYNFDKFKNIIKYIKEYE